MSSFGIVLTSRNNYRMLEELWLPRMKILDSFNDFEVLNIDEDSVAKGKKTGKKICSNNNLIYMDREKRGMHNNFASAIKYFEPKGAKYLLWFQHDSWPLQNDFLLKFDKLIGSGNLDRFGLVGFNAIAQNIMPETYDKMIQDLKDGKKPIGVLARSHLGTGDPWHCGVSSRRVKRPLKNHERFRKPFAIECPAWFACAINIEKYKQHIDTSHPFEFHRSIDDQAHQFLKHNIFNIVLPNFYIDHRPDLKPSVALPERSVRFAYKDDDRYHGLIGFKPEYWIKQWGWNFDKRDTFSKVEKRYKNTLLCDFYHHNPQDGPLKTFDFI